MDGRKEVRYRHELKFLCTQLQIELLEGQLECLMEKDRHSGSAGFYTVRSLYFDDYDNRAVKQKQDGLDCRKKYRIRSYLQGMDEVFHLEIKHRVKDRIRKESCTLEPEEVRKILAAEPVAYGTDDTAESSVRNRFAAARERMLLQPAVIVEYDRIPYVYPEGNVRITIDRNICGSPETGKFLERDIMEVPVLERGYHLLEIKYDEYLPDVIRQSIQVVSLDRISFSKYYLCRLAENPLKMGIWEGAGR
jgi:VTC domain.